jgi:hypothetical protein
MESTRYVTAFQVTMGIACLLQCDHYVTWLLFNEDLKSNITRNSEFSYFPPLF